MSATDADYLACVQVWRVAHPPERGSYLLGTQPMVHAGFQQSWTDQGFNERVLQKLRQVVEAGVAAGTKHWRIILTGHRRGILLLVSHALTLGGVQRSMPRRRCFRS